MLMNDLLPDNANILDECLSALSDQGKTVDDCLASMPESQAVEPLLRLAGRLQAARRLTAPLAFRQSACQRLEQRIAANANAQADSPVPIRTPPDAIGIPPDAIDIPQTLALPRADQRRTAHRLFPVLRLPVLHRPAWVYAACFVLLLCALLVSTTSGYASRALPGDPFYPLKIASEQVQLALAPSPARDASLHLKFADQRFEEMTTLISAEKTDHLGATVTSYRQELNAVNSYAQSKEITPPEKAVVVRQLTQQIVNHDRQLSDLLSALAKTSPATTGETLNLIRTETQPAADLLRVMFAVLRDEIRQDSDLLKEFEDFSEFEKLMEPGPTRRAETPAPRATSTRFLWTPTPTSGVSTLEEEESELPSRVNPDWPTHWITDWATLIPDILTTPRPGLIETLLPDPLPEILPTYIPTYLPTYLPTFFPPDDGDDDDGDDDDAPPGWEWPEDFPDEEDFEGPPSCWGCP
jgi:hypothetical protein